MKKFYNRLDDLLNDDINYHYEDYVSAYTIIDTYLKNYKSELENLNNYDITNLLNSRLNENLHGYFTRYDEKKVLAEIYNENNEKLISLRYNCSKISEPKLDYVITTNETYKEGDIELFNNILKDELIKYRKLTKKFDNDYDGTHKGMHSLNSIFFLYFLDNEIIIFPSKFNYMDITINDDNTLAIDYKNMDLLVQASLSGKEEKLLKNVYFNINDAPEFLKWDLYAKRHEELKDLKDNFVTKDSPLKRIRKWIKK